MKHTTYLSIMAALSLAASAQAAEKSTRATTRDQTLSTTTETSTFNDRDFGQVERWTHLKGREVLGTDNKKLGKLEDAVADLGAGRILYVIVGSGGVGPIGEKKYALAPGAFTDMSGKNLHFNGDKAKLEGAPEFTKEMDKDAERGKADFMNKVYTYFGQNAWWQGPNAPATSGQFETAFKVSDLMNKNVKNVNDEDMGKIDNAMLNLRAGRVAFLILSPASSQALGNNLYALPPNAFSINKDGKSLTSDITKEKLAAAPHFDKNNWEQVSDPAWAGQVYQYYGKQAWFDTTGSKLQPTGRPEDKSDKNKNKF
jgi:sporulation protein YlmC with PRC-barrel domain